MKYVISERQFNLIKEQVSDSRFGPEQYMNQQERQAYHSGNSEKAADALLSGSNKQMEHIRSLDPHTIMLVLGIASAFLPVVGPIMALGIGLADSALYLKQGDKKTAGLVALFSAIPAAGSLATKLGLTQWTARQLGEIGKKLSFGTQLTQNEIQVVNRVAKYKDLIKSEMDKLGKTATIEAGKKGVKNKIVKQTVAKNVGKTAGVLGAYGGLGYTYNKVYDKIFGGGIDLNSVQIKDVSDVNKKAASEIKF